MYGEGFMNKRLEMRRFELHGDVTKEDDFSYCLFMILPFQDLNSFSQQQNLLDIFDESKPHKQRNILKRLIDSLSITSNLNLGLGEEKKLEERKIKINDLKNRLENELQYNINTVQR